MQTKPSLTFLIHEIDLFPLQISAKLYMYWSFVIHFADVLFVKLYFTANSNMVQEALFFFFFF